MNATPAADDQRTTLDFFEKSHARWVSFQRKATSGGAFTATTEDAAQARSVRWRRDQSTSYVSDAVEALELIGALSRMCGGSTLDPYDPANVGVGTDERVSGWLVFLVQLGVMLHEYELAIAPVLELAERWAHGEERPLNPMASLVYLTARFASASCGGANVSSDDRASAFLALTLATAAAIVETKATLHGRAEWAKPWPKGVSLVEQYRAAVDFVCGPA